jgi:hypothetical protein
MGGIVEHLDSKNLVPFKRRRNGYHLPGLTKEKEEQVIDEVDPELRPEEQGYVRHYLGYADVMLKNAAAEAEAAPEEGPAGQSTAAKAPEHLTEQSAASKVPVQLHDENIVECKNKDNVTEMPMLDRKEPNAA